MYKDLGVDESNGIQHKNTEFNSENCIEVINSLTILVVTYSFNITKWAIPETRRLDTKIHKLLTCNRMHHPKADVDRLYIPGNEGGRRMIQLELSHKTSTIGQYKYLTTTTDWMLQLVLTHDRTQKAHYIRKSNKTGKANLCMESTHYEAKTMI